MTRFPSYTSHDGFLMPLGFPIQGFVSGLTFSPSPDDVFVATYPKCGTTWMQHIIWLLAHSGRPMAGDDRLTEKFPHLEEVGSAHVERLPQPRLIKTHLPFSMTPYHPGARYICVARNPFDCAVSFFHHTRGFPQHYDFADGTFDDYFECFIAGDVDFGSYFEHLVSWGQRTDEDNVLFTTFEAMRSDARAVILEVARFLGGEFAAAADDPALVDQVLEHSSFRRMSKDQQRWSSERPDGATRFLRKGRVGDWENHFSHDQVRRLVREFDRWTAGTWLTELWPDILGKARSVGPD